MLFQPFLLLFKNRVSVAVLSLLVLVLCVSSCEVKDPYASMYPPFDVAGQKVKDEADIRLYFRKNNIDTTSTDLVRTPSGLYYLKTKAGVGYPFKTGDRVEVHYRGTFLWGQEFDNSYNRGNAFVVNIGTTGVIAGWTEGLKLMRPQEEGILFVPSHLAYGPYDQRGFANQVLIFEMKVLNK